MRYMMDPRSYMWHMSQGGKKTIKQIYVFRNISFLFVLPVTYRVCLFTVLVKGH